LTLKSVDRLPSFPVAWVSLESSFRPFRRCPETQGASAMGFSPIPPGLPPSSSTNPLQPSAPAPPPQTASAGTEVSHPAAQAPPSDNSTDASAPPAGPKPKPPGSRHAFDSGRDRAGRAAAQKVSDRLAAAPAAERGKLAAELLEKGDLNQKQLAD